MAAAILPALVGAPVLAQAPGQMKPIPAVASASPVAAADVQSATEPSPYAFAGPEVEALIEGARAEAEGEALRAAPTPTQQVTDAEFATLVRDSLVGRPWWEKALASVLWSLEDLGWPRTIAVSVAGIGILGGAIGGILYARRRYGPSVRHLMRRGAEVAAFGSGAGLLVYSLVLQPDNELTAVVAGGICLFLGLGLRALSVWDAKQGASKG